MPSSKHVYCVALAFKMTEWVEQQICIKFCIKLEHSSVETIPVIQKLQLVTGSFIMTTCLLMHLVSCRIFLAKHQITQVTQSPYRWDLELCDFLLFQKLKSPLKEKRFQTVRLWDLGKYDGQLMTISTKDFAECFKQWKRLWENCVRSQDAYFERDWGIIGLCVKFLVSWIFIINVSGFS